jgi:hypothetical protein
MGSVVERIDEELRSWIESQPVFFVASAPLSADGHVNVSPKGLDSLSVVDDHTVRYLDLTGSGAETVAHLKENGRLTLMFCAFEGNPRIIRLYGSGVAHLIGSEGFDERAASFASVPHSARAIVEVAVSRIQSSCGYGVPLMDFVEPRERLTKWGAARTAEQLAAYRENKNSLSIDGLPAFGAQSDASG